MKDKTFDLRGQICPSTLLLTLKYIEEYKSEMQKEKLYLHILTDHRDALHTIPDTVEKMGFEARIYKNLTFYKISIYWEKS